MVISAMMGLSAVLAGAITACGSDYARTEGNYCTTVRANLDHLNPDVVTSGSDVSAVVTAWSRVSATAPLQVQPEWDTVLASLRIVAAVDPNKPDSVQHMADTARASTQAANRVISYTYKKCGVLIGTVKPVTVTIPPQVFPPTTV